MTSDLPISAQIEILYDGAVKVLRGDEAYTFRGKPTDAAVTLWFTRRGMNFREAAAFVAQRPVSPFAVSTCTITEQLSFDNPGCC